MRSWTVEELETRVREFDRYLEAARRRNPLKLIKHPREGVIPFRLWSRQREFIENCRATQCISCWVGPNRPGKSTAAAAYCVETLIGIPIEQWAGLPDDVAGLSLRPQPVRIGCITISSDKSITGQQAEFARFLHQNWLSCGPYTERTGWGGKACRLVLRNGGTVDFLSELQPDQTFEQFAWHLCWIDEAVDEWIKDRVVARLVDTRGKLLITAVGEKAWLNRLSRMRLLRMDSTDPCTPEFLRAVHGSTMLDNELLTPADIRRAETFYGGAGSRSARMRIAGEDVLAEGLVIDRFDPLIHVEPAGPVPRGWTRYEGADDGYANPFAWVFLAVDADGIYHVFDEIYERRRYPHEIADLLLAKRARWDYDQPYIPAVIDPAAYIDQHWGRRKVSVADELSTCGIRTQRGDNNPAALRGAEAVINRLLDQQRLFIRGNCRWLIHELYNYRTAPPDPHTGEHIGDRERKIDAHNHLIRALGYLLSARPVHVPLPIRPPRGSVAADLADRRRDQQRRRKSIWR